MIGKKIKENLKVKESLKHKSLSITKLGTETFLSKKYLVEPIIDTAKCLNEAKVNNENTGKIKHIMDFNNLKQITIKCKKPEIKEYCKTDKISNEKKLKTKGKNNVKPLFVGHIRKRSCINNNIESKENLCY